MSMGNLVLLVWIPHFEKVGQVVLDNDCTMEIKCSLYLLLDTVVQ